MKKIFTLILLFLSLITFFKAGAFAAQGFVPPYVNSIKYYGTGALRVANRVIIYEKMDEKSKIVQEIYWNNTGKLIASNNNAAKKAPDIFLAFSPDENMALFAGEDYDDTWTKVCYDQKQGLFGWIKSDKDYKTSKFYPYKDLFFKFGKKYGIYIFRNLSDEHKTLRSAPNDLSRMVDEFDMPKFIIPWLVQGNWMLIKVTTYDGKTKTGWFRWRTDEGRLKVFINF